VIRGWICTNLMDSPPHVVHPSENLGDRVLRNLLRPASKLDIDAIQVTGTNR
jgi:hypothetical protein